MKSEKRKLLNAIFTPILLIVLFWVIKLWEKMLGTQFVVYGNYPLQIKNIYGIFSMHFIHANIEHLASNSIPFLILCTALFYFHRKYALQILVFLAIFTGLSVWLFARSAYHIGASGLVYGIASFLIFSGFIHNNKELTGLAFIVILLYGSLARGIFPEDSNVSWEGHLAGAIAGLLASGLFSKKIDLEQQKALPASYKEYKYLSITDENITYVKYKYKDDNS